MEFPQRVPRYPVTRRVLRPDRHRVAVDAVAPDGQVVVRGVPEPMPVGSDVTNRSTDDCHVQAVGVTSVGVTLGHPLGTRHFVQALNGKPIKYHIGHF